MLGKVPDWLLTTFERKYGPMPSEVLHLQRGNKDSPDKRLYFVPAAVIKHPGLRKMLDIDADIAVVVTPKKIIQPDPSQTRAYMDTALEESVERYGNIPRAVKGVSIANCIATRYASRAPVTKLTLITPGSSLPECIFASASTRKIALASGRPFKEFKEQLDHLGPIRNLDGLNTRNIEMHIGDSDLLIPPESGQELIDAMHAKGLYPAIISHKNSGHVETIFRVAHVHSKEGQREETPVLDYQCQALPWAMQLR